MMYLLCFAVSVAFAYLAYKTNDRKRFWIYSVVSIAVVVLLAGLRAYSVGIDVMSYYEKARYWKGAINAKSLFAYMKYYIGLKYGEPLFALLVGTIAKITGEYRVFLFSTQAIIVTGVYIGVFRQRKYINPAFVLLLFYLLFFNHSLNIIRQYIAMAIVFAAFADIQEKKYLRYCIAVVVAMGFHTTAVIALGPLVLHFLMYYEHSKLEKFTPAKRSITIAGILGLAVIFFAPLVRLAMKTGVLNDRYEFFLKDDAVSPAVIVSVIALMGLTALFLFRKQVREQCEHANFFAMCSIAYVILLQLTWTVAFGKRIAFYFAFPDLLTVGLIESSIKTPRMKNFMRIGILCVALAYWLYVYVYRNASETIPYRFSF